MPVDEEILEALISKLPEWLQALGRAHLPWLLQIPEDDLKAWLELQNRGDWRGAYRIMVRNMSTEQLRELRKATNAAFEAANSRNARRSEMMRQLVNDATAILIALGKAYIVAQLD
jgi:hypothetical protein